MSEQVVPTNQVTSDDLFKQAVAEVMAENAPKPAVGDAPVPSPLKLNLGGQEITFNSQSELELALNQTLTHYNNQIQALSNPTPANQVTDDDGPSFDQEKYISLMKENPVEAADYVDNFRYFGGKATGPVRDQIKQVLATAEANQQLMQTYQFRAAHPEFQGDQRIAQTIDQVRNQLGLPWTADGLEAAYLVAQHRNMVPRFEASQQAPPPVGGQFPQQNQYFGNGGPQQQYPQQYQNFAPPAIGRGSHTSESFPDPESMSLEQLERIINSSTRR
jgi:hypothetical protein